MWIMLAVGEHMLILGHKPIMGGSNCFPVYDILQQEVSQSCGRMACKTTKIVM